MKYLDIPDEEVYRRVIVAAHEGGHTVEELPAETVMTMVTQARKEIFQQAGNVCVICGGYTPDLYALSEGGMVHVKCHKQHFKVLSKLNVAEKMN
jgi:hypothetical protein